MLLPSRAALRSCAPVFVDDGIGGASTQAVLDWVYERLIEHGFRFSQRGPWATVLGFGVHRDRALRTATVTATQQIRALVREHLASEVASNLNPATPSNETIMKLPAYVPETDEQIAANLSSRRAPRHTEAPSA